MTYDEQQLLDLFSQYGEVVQTRILRDQNTTFSRRIGFVIMATKQMAQVAIQNLDNTIPNGASEPIFVKYADEEGKKRGSGGGGGGGNSNNHRNNHQHRGNHHHNQHQHHHHNQHHQNNQGNFHKCIFLTNVKIKKKTLSSS
jgi:RNA recognition motif-containing protein